MEGADAAAAEETQRTTKTVKFDETVGQAKEETYEDALRVFYGVDTTQKEADKLGHPIPGYCGFNRRVQADNVFGMTYAEARRRAHESQARIEQEKGDTLKSTAVFIPEYTKKSGEHWH